VPRVGYRLPQPRPEAAGNAASGLPAIGVLPFANLSDDRDQDYFADGITEDLITALSRFRAFSVISRGSSFALRGRVLDAREAGRLLGARYLLEGSVRRAGDAMRVTAQLADVETGGQLWAERFDGGREDIFAMQDRITAAVVGFIQPEIQLAEIERARRKRPENLDAYDLYLRAFPLVQSADPAAYEPALALLRRATALDGNFAIALACLSWVLEKRQALELAGSRPEDKTEATELARRALAAGGDDPRVMAIAGFVLTRFSDVAAGLAAARRAHAINPNDLLVLNMAGYSEVLVGDADLAGTLFGRAVELAPNAPESYLNMTGMAFSHFHAKRYQAALEWGQRSLQTFNDWPVTYWVLVAAAAWLGRQSEMAAYVGRLRELTPAVTIAQFERDLSNTQPNWPLLIEGLKKAGLT